MKRPLELRYLWGRKKTRRLYFGTGLGLFALMVFAFSVLSFFRPYYEHQNSYLPSSEATLVVRGNKTDYKSAEEVLADASSIHHEDWARIEARSDGKNVLSLLNLYGETQFAILTGPAGFDLSCLGKLASNPGLTIPGGGKTLALITERHNPSVLEKNAFLNSLDPEKGKPTVYSDSKYGGVDMGFRPFKTADILYVTSSDNLPASLQYSLEEVYETFHLKDALPDEDVIYYGTLTGYNAGVLSPTLVAFLHPGLPYLRFYPPFHAISMLLLTLSLTIAFSLMFAQWAKDLVTPKEERAELKALKTMGLKQGGYLLGALFQSALPLLLSSMIVLAAYHIFMGAFFGFAGFTFYFAWYWYLVYFLPVLLTGAFKAIQGTVEFQREISANQ